MAALIDTVGEVNPPVPEGNEQSTEGLRQWCMYYIREIDLVYTEVRRYTWPWLMYWSRRLEVLFEKYVANEERVRHRTQVRV